MRKPSGAAKDPPSAKKPKQQSLKTSFARATTSPAALPANVQAHPPFTLSAAQTADLESSFDSYCQNWGEKCAKESNKTRGGAARDDVDLDTRGMHFVTTFRRAAEVAAAQGVAVPSPYLEALVLIVRNDVVHQTSHVAKSAHATLMAYLHSRPYAKLAHYSGAAGAPYVITTPANVWLPLEDDRSSFSAKYLLTPDMSIAGRNFRADRAGAGGPQRQRDNKFSSPIELIAHCVQKALDSAEVDFNGDLQLLQYLLVVIEQDLDVRLAAHDEMKNGNEENSKTLGRRRALLEASLAWRIFAGPLVSAEARRELVRQLVALIIMSEDPSVDEAMAAAEEEPEDDAPAAVCIFTPPELSAMGACILRTMLRLFGAAEASGAYLATAKHRSASVNHRMDMDTYMIDAFWSEKGLCKRPECARSFLQSLPARDRLRFLGLLAAQKFTRTYDTSSLGTFGKVVGDLSEYLAVCNGMLERGGSAVDVDSFFEVNLCPVVASLYREPARAAKTYKSADHLAVMVAAVVTAVQTLVAQGEEVPTGAEGVQGLKRELLSAVEAVAALGKGDETGSELILSSASVCNLVLARMSVNAL